MRKNITKMLFIRSVLASYILSLSSCSSHFLFSFHTLAVLTKSGGILFLTVSQTNSHCNIQFPEGAGIISRDVLECDHVFPKLKKGWGVGAKKAPVIL